MKFTLDQIKNVLNKKGYQFFDGAINIIGIRSANDIANSFDDWLYLIYKDSSGQLKQYEYPITTDPGAYWLQNPLNLDGTAVLVPGQYIDSHEIGYHKRNDPNKRYEALTQSSKLKVWRDNTKDNKIDKGGKIHEGIFGINIHRSNATSQSQVVEKWSAGCQVFQKVADFNFFMDVCRNSGQQLFTYTLLEENDF